MPVNKKAKGSMTVTIGELSQEVDLKSYLGRRPTSAEKELFSSIAIETINTRTLDNKDINDDYFTDYSPGYAAKKGVTEDSVDLFLNGDMLDSIGRRKSREKVGSVFIQMKKGLQTKKGFNHQKGDTLPTREFFGITDMEARNIVGQVKQKFSANEEKAKKEKVSSLKALQDALRIIGIEQVN